MPLRSVCRWCCGRSAPFVDGCWRRREWCCELAKSGAFSWDARRTVAYWGDEADVFNRMKERRTFIYCIFRDKSFRFKLVHADCLCSLVWSLLIASAWNLPLSTNTPTLPSSEATLDFRSSSGQIESSLSSGITRDNYSGCSSFLLLTSKNSSFRTKEFACHLPEWRTTTPHFSCSLGLLCSFMFRKKKPKALIIELSSLLLMIDPHTSFNRL